MNLPDAYVQPLLSHIAYEWEQSKRIQFLLRWLYMLLTLHRPKKDKITLKKILARIQAVCVPVQKLVDQTKGTLMYLKQAVQLEKQRRRLEELMMEEEEYIPTEVGK